MRKPPSTEESSIPLLREFLPNLALDDVPVGLWAGDVWRNLDDAFFQALHKVLKNKTITVDPYIPRKHQKKAIKEAYRHFVQDKETRGKMIMPCGAGKSLTSYWVADKLKAKSFSSLIDISISFSGNPVIFISEIPFTAFNSSSIRSISFFK